MRTHDSWRAGIRLLLALVAGLVCGCAAARGAYDDRFGWLVNGKPPTIRFGCETKPVTRAVDWAGLAPIPVFVPGLARSGTRLAADVVRWSVGNGAPVDVNVEGPPPEQVLARDVVDVMARSGFLLVGAPAAGVLTLTAAMTGVSVDTLPGGLFDAPTRTKAAVDFAVKLASGDVSKEIPFKGEHALSLFSAIASSPETTVNHAYCAGLQSFADAVSLPPFVREIRDLVARQPERSSSDPTAGGL